MLGLNDSYGQARSQILLMSHLLSINQTYAIVIGDKSQKSVSVVVGLLGANPMTTSSGNEIAMYSRIDEGQKVAKNSHMYCNIC